MPFISSDINPATGFSLSSVESELTYLLQNDPFILDVDFSLLKALISQGFPNQKSAFLFISWVNSQLSKCGFLISQVTLSDPSSPELHINSWLIYERFSFFVPVCKTFLSTFKFNKLFKANVINCFTIYKPLYHLTKSDRDSLKSNYLSSLSLPPSTPCVSFSSPPPLSNPKDFLLYSLQLLIHPYLFPSPSNNPDNSKCFSQITSCLLSHLLPFSHTHPLSSLIDSSPSYEKFFTSIILNPDDFFSIAKLSTYSHILNSLPPETLSLIFNPHDGISFSPSSSGFILFSSTFLLPSHSVPSLSPSDKKFLHRASENLPDILDPDYHSFVSKINSTLSIASSSSSSLSVSPSISSILLPILNPNLIKSGIQSLPFDPFHAFDLTSLPPKKLLRIYTIQLHLNHFSALDISLILSVSRNFVYTWVKAYNKFGTSAFI